MLTMYIVHFNCLISKILLNFLRNFFQNFPSVDRAYVFVYLFFLLLLIWTIWMIQEFRVSGISIEKILSSRRSRAKNQFRLASRGQAKSCQSVHWSFPQREI